MQLPGRLASSGCLASRFRTLVSVASEQKNETRHLISSGPAVVVVVVVGRLTYLGPALASHNSTRYKSDDVSDISVEHGRTWPDEGEEKSRLGDVVGTGDAERMEERVWGG